MAFIDELIERRKHPDPVTLAGNENSAQREARLLRLTGAGARVLREALLLRGAVGIRDSVLDDLRTFFTDSYFSTVDRGERLAREQVAMWSVNLLWYAYVQAEGFADPVQVEIAAAAAAPTGARAHLDFGSGVGLTSQLFHAHGYELDLADIEDGLLDFASFRLERRGIRVRSIHLKREGLASGRYDVITAIDTLTFVPDFRAAVRDLRRALKSQGVLLANFDVRHDVQIGWAILHHDDLRLRRILQQTGFEPETRLSGGVRRYRAVDTEGIGHLRRFARDAILFPARRAYRTTRARLS